MHTSFHDAHGRLHLLAEARRNDRREHHTPKFLWGFGVFWCGSHGKRIRFYFPPVNAGRRSPLFFKTSNTHGGHRGRDGMQRGMRQDARPDARPQEPFRRRITHADTLILRYRGWLTAPRPLFPKKMLPSHSVDTPTVRNWSRRPDGCFLNQRLSSTWDARFFLLGLMPPRGPTHCMVGFGLGPTMAKTTVEKDGV